ncbi:MAG: hypothetical protein ACKV2U_31070 [Bryobacteraceae bacterium]
MKFELADTSPEMMEVWIECARRLTPGQRLEQVFEQIEFGDTLLISEIRKMHPSYSDYDVRRELALRKYGEDLAYLAFPRRMTA